MLEENLLDHNKSVFVELALDFIRYFEYTVESYLYN